MKNDNATLNVPSDVLTPIIEAHVAKAVIEALGGREDILARAITFFMNVQVDSEGKAANYNGKPWIQWAIMNSIQKAAKGAIEEHLTQNAELMKKQLVAELQNRKSPVARQLAESMIAGIGNGETLKWRLEIKCNP